MQRLFDEENVVEQLADVRILAINLPVCREGRDVGKLFVAIECQAEIRSGRLAEQGLQRAQPRQVALQHTAEFHFEMVETVSADTAFERVWKAIAERLCDFLIRQRIAEADRVPRNDS